MQKIKDWFKDRLPFGSQEWAIRGTIIHYGTEMLIYTEFEIDLNMQNLILSEKYALTT